MTDRIDFLSSLERQTCNSSLSGRSVLEQAQRQQHGGRSEASSERSAGSSCASGGAGGVWGAGSGGGGGASSEDARPRRADTAWNVPRHSLSNTTRSFSRREALLCTLLCILS